MIHNLCGCRFCGGLDERLLALEEVAYERIIRGAEARRPYYEAVRGETALANRTVPVEDGWRVLRDPPMNFEPCVRFPSDPLFCIVHDADYGDGRLWCESVMEMVTRIEARRR